MQFLRKLQKMHAVLNAQQHDWLMEVFRKFLMHFAKKNGAFPEQHTKFFASFCCHFFEKIQKMN